VPCARGLAQLCDRTPCLGVVFAEEITALQMALPSLFAPHCLDLEALALTLHNVGSTVPLTAVLTADYQQLEAHVHSAVRQIAQQSKSSMLSAFGLLSKRYASTCASMNCIIGLHEPPSGSRGASAVATASMVLRRGTGVGVLRVTEHAGASLLMDVGSDAHAPSVQRLAWIASATVGRLLETWPMEIVARVDGVSPGKAAAAAAAAVVNGVPSRPLPSTSGAGTALVRAPAAECFDLRKMQFCSDYSRLQLRISCCDNNRRLWTPVSLLFK
jgi:hypothetical protein